MYKSIYLSILEQVYMVPVSKKGAGFSEFNISYFLPASLDLGNVEREVQ